MSRDFAFAPALAARPVSPAAMARLGFGHAALDARLEGGLAVAALHEIYAASPADGAAAAALALMLALRCERPGPILWLGEDREQLEGRLHGAGLAELGCDPARLLLVQAPDTLALLRAAAEAVASSAACAVIIAPCSKPAALDLTASRRLALAAARSGVFTLLLRSGTPLPSAAQSRWQVAAAPSAALAANAPGLPAFEIGLLRHRGGLAAFSLQMEWNRECRAFGPVLSGAVPAAAAERTGVAGRRRAA